MQRVRPERQRLPRGSRGRCWVDWTFTHRGSLFAIATFGACGACRPSARRRQAARANRWRPSGRGLRGAVAPRPRPRPRPGGWKLEILELRPARVHGVCRRAAVEAKQAHELCPVGCSEDAGGHDLLPARPLPGPLGELDEEIEAGADREGQAEPDRALGAGGERRLGRELRVRPASEGRTRSRHVFIIC
jgi:hypothetical protein